MGTDYVASFFLNTNERIPSEAVSGIFEIIDMITHTFTNAEAKEATLSAPLMEKWGSLIFILTKKKGICFTLDSWIPSRESLLLQADKNDTYLCNDQSGYLAAGEPISFTKDAKGDILGVKWGSHYIPTEQTFLRNIKKTFL